MIHSFPKGSSIQLALENMDNAVLSAPPVAKIKALSGGKAVGPVLGTFTTEARADLGNGFASGWVFILTTPLPVGDYGVDARLTPVGGSPIVTSMEVVKVTPSAAG